MQENSTERGRTARIEAIRTWADAPNTRSAAVLSRSGLDENGNPANGYAPGVSWLLRLGQPRSDPKGSPMVVLTRCAPLARTRSTHVPLFLEKHFRDAGGTRPYHSPARGAF